MSVETHLAVVQVVLIPSDQEEPKSERDTERGRERVRK